MRVKLLSVNRDLSLFPVVTNLHWFTERTVTDCMFLTERVFTVFSVFTDFQYLLTFSVT